MNRSLWVALAALTVLGACSKSADDSVPTPVPGPERAKEPATIYGAEQSLGEGSIRSYVELDADEVPTEVGVEFGMAALDGLPTQKNNYSRCFDSDGDEVLDAATECDGDFELRLPVPENAAAADLPYQWVGINLNPEGHVPPNWSVPHFDFHFYVVEQATIDGIRTGPCGMHMNCEDQETALLPVPEQYMPPAYISIGAAVPAMGNHLVDSTSSQMGPPFDPATHVLIYGAYNAQIIFIEPMITTEFMLGKPDACYPVAQPAAVEQGGYYPQSYCIKYDQATDSIRVSLQDLVQRAAS